MARGPAPCAGCRQDRLTASKARADCPFLLRHNTFFFFLFLSSSNSIWCYVFHDVLLSFLVRSVGLWFHVLVLHKLHSVWLIGSSHGQERMCCLQLSGRSTNAKAMDLEKSYRELIFFFFSREIVLPEEWSALAWSSVRSKLCFVILWVVLKGRGGKLVFTAGTVEVQLKNK